MQKKKFTKRKCLGVENSNEFESLDNLNNPYGYDFSFNGRSLQEDNYTKLQRVFNNNYFDKR